MSLVVRLRVELADVPGSLARAAAIIADYGGNITGIDVQRDGGSAIDEITVEVDELKDLARLRRELAESGAARVVSFQSASSEDLLVRVLRRITEVLIDDAATDRTRLLAGIAELCATPAVWISAGADCLVLHGAAIALSQPGEACIVKTTGELPHVSGTLASESWLLSVAGRGGGEDQWVVHVARPATKRFTVTEVNRVEALVRLHAAFESTRRNRVPA